MIRLILIKIQSTFNRFQLEFFFRSHTRRHITRASVNTFMNNFSIPESLFVYSMGQKHVMLRVSFRIWINSLINQDTNIIVMSLIQRLKAKPDFIRAYMQHADANSEVKNLYVTMSRPCEYSTVYIYVEEIRAWRTSWSVNYFFITFEHRVQIVFINLKLS